MEPSRPPRTCRILLVGIYLLILGASVTYMLVNLHKTAFCGLFTLLATLPWSTALLKACDAAGIKHDYLGFAVLAASAVLNIVLLYAAGWFLDLTTKPKPRIADSDVFTEN